MTSGSGLQVVILAGGRGVRMLSEIPKVLHTICGRSLIARLLVSSLAINPRRVIVVTGYRGDLVTAEIDRLKNEKIIPDGAEIAAVLQTEQKGTGHAVMVAESSLGGAPDSLVMILPGDAPLVTGADLASFLEAHQKSGADLSVITARVPDPAGFGRIIRDGSGRVTAIVEKKDCRPEQLHISEINSSLYVVKLGLLREALKVLKPNNAQGEYYLTDIVSYAVGKKIPVNGIEAGDYRRVLGANDRVELSALQAIRRREINESLMRSGVTLEDPGNTYVDEGVTVGADTFLGSGTRLRGRTSLGSQVIVDGNSLIQDSAVADRCHVKLSCHLEGASIGAGSFVGPFARLRPGTKLHEDVHVGNFVEAKNTEFGRGAKANHVSYLGDSSIGSASNIGAGTIFCNYDGTKKSKTIIGESVFVGSNSTVVAPVTISSGSYVAAGSVVTEDVPSDALGIGRARQTNILDWVKRRRNTVKGEK